MLGVGVVGPPIGVMLHLFRRASLAADAVSFDLRGGGRAARLDGGAHALHDFPCGVRRDGAALLLGYRGDDFAVCLYNTVDDVGLHHLPAIGDGPVGLHHLEGSDHNRVSDGDSGDVGTVPALDGMQDAVGFLLEDNGVPVLGVEAKPSALPHAKGAQVVVELHLAHVLDDCFGTADVAGLLDDLHEGQVTEADVAVFLKRLGAAVSPRAVFAVDDALWGEVGEVHGG